ncbi:MAG: hypothetical protein L6E13_12940, partial [Firmicutes bacterium]|nr:hypothetical protein [Bacillota bacterium]
MPVLIPAGLGTAAYLAKRFWDRQALERFGHDLPSHHYFSWRAWQHREKAGGFRVDLRDVRPGRLGGNRFGSAAPAATGGAGASAPRPPGMEVWPAAVDALVAGFAPAMALAQIDPRVVEAVDFAFREDIAEFGHLQELVRSAKALDPEAYAGWFERLKGYVGEVVAADILARQGFEVELADVPNQPGWDLLVEGQPFNVKITDDPDRILEHFAEYPDIPVITSPEVAAELPPELQDHVLALEGLEADQIAELTQETLDGIEGLDIGPSFPVVTAALSALREIRLLALGQTDLGTSLRNAALDIAGTGIGGWVGAELGAAVGTAILPGLGTVVGAILAGVAGSVMGRAITNDIKLAAFRKALEEYQEQYARFHKTATEEHNLLVARVVRTIDIHRAELLAEIQAIRRRHEEAARQARNRFWDVAQDLGKRLPELLLRAEAELAEEQQRVLAELPRSPIWRRILWPSADDLRYRAVELWFTRQRQELRRMASEFSKNLDKLTPEAMLAEARKYLSGKIFDSAALKEAVDRVVSEYNA